MTKSFFKSIQHLKKKKLAYIKASHLTYIKFSMSDYVNTYKQKLFRLMKLAKQNNKYKSAAKLSAPEHTQYYRLYRIQYLKELKVDFKGGGEKKSQHLALLLRDIQLASIRR